MIEWGLIFYGTKDITHTSPSIMSPDKQSTVQDLSSVGNCELMPVQDPPEEKRIEPIVLVLPIFLTVVVSGFLVILTIRRKQIYSLVCSKYCTKKIDIVKDDEETDQFKQMSAKITTYI